MAEDTAMASDDNLVVANPAAGSAQDGGPGANVTAGGDESGGAGGEGGFRGADEGDGPGGVSPDVKSEECDDDTDIDWDEYYDDTDLPELLDYPHDPLEDCICNSAEFLHLDFDDFYEIFGHRSSMNKWEMRQYHLSLWEHHDGMPLNRHDSDPYASDTRRTYKERFYARCTAKELKQFVVGRGMVDPYPPGVTMKYYYIKLLERNDRQATFQFMDLPTEMRIHVYEHLLSVPTGEWDSGTCSPSILRASRLVYQEARDILYNNTISVDFRVRQQNHGAIIRSVKVHTDEKLLMCDHSRYYRMPSGIDDYPEFFRHIRRLEIRVHYSVSGDTRILLDGAYPINHFLYTLSSFLMEGHQLHHLHLVFDFPDEDEEKFGSGSFFYPLCRLSNIKQVTFAGYAPKYVKKTLRRQMMSTEPAFNTMRHWKLLEEQATAQLSLMSSLDLAMCECSECPAPQCVEAINDSLESLAEAKMESCFSSTLEENFIARLNHLKKRLGMVNVDRIKRLFEEALEKRAALDKHEETSDGGRLAEAGKIWAGRLDDQYGDFGGDWDSDDSCSEQDDEGNVQSAADGRQLLDKGEVADIMEEWEPDAASQLSRGSSPSAYEPDDSAPASP